MAVSYTHLDVYKRQEGGASVSQIGTAVSAILLKSMVEENAKDFLGWTQTGTHTETIDGGDGEEDEEIEIVDYAIVVKLNPNLTPTGTGYSYSYVTKMCIRDRLTAICLRL